MSLLEPSKSMIQLVLPLLPQQHRRELLQTGKPHWGETTEQRLEKSERDRNCGAWSTAEFKALWPCWPGYCSTCLATTTPKSIPPHKEGSGDLIPPYSGSCLPLNPCPLPLQPQRPPLCSRLNWVHEEPRGLDLAQGHRWVWHSYFKLDNLFHNIWNAF